MQKEMSLYNFEITFDLMFRLKCYTNLKLSEIFPYPFCGTTSVFIILISIPSGFGVFIVVNFFHYLPSLQYYLQMHMLLFLLISVHWLAYFYYLIHKYTEHTLPCTSLNLVWNHSAFSRSIHPKYDFDLILKRFFCIIFFTITRTHSSLF